MMRISLLLTVLGIVALPLTAAALDYGPDQRMLAAEASAPSLPSTHNDENPYAALTATHRAHMDDDDSAAQPEPPPVPRNTVRRDTTPAVSAPAAGSPHGHGVLTWQSLLPGSIQ